MSRTLKDRPWRIRGTLAWANWANKPAGPKVARYAEKINPARVHYSNAYGPGWFRRMTVYHRERPEFRDWAATLHGDLSEADCPPLRYREYWD